jgi:hypothetical protein
VNYVDGDIPVTVENVRGVHFEFVLESDHEELRVLLVL